MRKAFHGSENNAITRKRFKLRNILLLGLIPLFLISLATGLATMNLSSAYAADMGDELVNYLEFGNLTSLNGLTGYYITRFNHQEADGFTFGETAGHPMMIPAQYKGYPILGISGHVFSGHNEISYVSFRQLNGTSGTAEELAAYNRLPDELKKLGTAISTLGEGCFENCTALVSIRLPASVTELGNDCFKGDVKLATVNSIDIDGAPKDSMQGLCYLKRIGAKCFRMGAGVLDNVVLPDFAAGSDATAYFPQGKGLETVADTGFYVTTGMNQESVTTNVNGKNETGFLAIPESCTNILETAFFGMNARIYLKGGPGTYEYYPFGYSVHVGPAGGKDSNGKEWPPNIVWNTTNKSVYGTVTLNGVLFNFNKEKGILGCPVTADGGAAVGTGLGNVVIPNSVTVDGTVYSIANGKLKGIAPGMFSHSKVTGIAFHPDWNGKLTHVPTAFADSAYDTQTEYVASSNKWYAIGYTGLTTILNMPDSITEVGAMCFYSCKALKHITTTSTTTVSGDGSQWSDYSTPTAIRFGSWNGTSNDNTIILPTSCKKLGFWALNGCAATTVIIPAAGKAEDFKISEAAFTGATLARSTVNNKTHTLTPGISAIYFPQFDTSDGKTPRAILNVSGRPEEQPYWESQSYPWAAADMTHTYYGASNTDLGAVSFTSGVWTYEINNEDENTVTITGCNYSNLSDKNALTFPTSLGGKTVTAIGNAYGVNHNIFSGNHTFTSVTIPEGVKTIKYCAFTGVTINQLNLPSTLESVEERAFTGAVSGILKLPKSMKSIGPLAFQGARFTNKTIVFPGEIQQVSATAFSGGVCPNLETVYYLQYRTQESDNVFDRQSGMYLRVDGTNAPSAAGTAGILSSYTGSGISGNHAPDVRYMDDFTPYIYEIGRTYEGDADPYDDIKEFDPTDSGNQSSINAELAKYKAVVEHKGAGIPYDRPYSDAVYAHPVPQMNEDGTAIAGWKADIRFGVRMLLQTETIDRILLVASPTGGKDDPGVTGLGTLYQPTAGSIAAKEFFNVVLAGANAEGTYIFRIFYKNQPLMDALRENGFSGEDENTFVYHYTINIDMLADATFEHAVIERVGGDLPANMKTDSEGNALVTSVEREYQDKADTTNELEVTATKQVLGSGIKLPTNVVFEHPNAEFIGWTTDYSLASKIWTDYPDETETIKNLDGTDMMKDGEPVTRQKFWRADGTNTDPFMVYVSDLDENVQVTFYSVFRLKINKAPTEPGTPWNWTYSEDPYPVGSGQKFLLPSSPVAAGQLSMFRIDETGAVSLVDPIMNFDEGGFIRAFDTAFNTSTHAGSYVVLNGDLTEEFELLDSKTREGFNAWRTALPNYVVSEFDVSKLALEIKAQKVTMTYGDYKYGKVEDGDTVEHYIAASLSTSNVSYTLGSRQYPGYPVGQTASDVFDVVITGRTEDGDYPHVADPDNTARNALTYTLKPKAIGNSSDYTFTGTTENIELEVTPRNIAVNVSMQRQTNEDLNVSAPATWSPMTANIEADGSQKQYYTWVYYGGAQKDGATVGREAAVISLSDNQPEGGGVIEADRDKADVLDYNYYFVQQDAPVVGGDGGYEAVGTSVYNVGNYYLGLYLTTKSGGATYNNKDYAITDINNISASSSTFTGSERGYNFYIGPRVEITKAIIERPKIAETYYGLIDDSNARTNLYAWLNPGGADAYKISAPENQDGFVAPAPTKAEIAATNLQLPTPTKSHLPYWDADTYSVGLKLPASFFANYAWEGEDTDTVQLAFVVKKAELKITVSDTSSYYNETKYIGSGTDTERGIVGSLSIVGGHGLDTLTSLFTEGDTRDTYAERTYTRNGTSYTGDLIDAGIYVFRYALKGDGLKNFIIVDGDNTDTDGGTNEWQISADGAYADINYTIHKAVMKVTLTGEGRLTEYYDGTDHVSDANQQAVFFNNNYDIANGTADEEYYILQYLYDAETGNTLEYGYRVTFRAVGVEQGVGNPSVTAVGSYYMIISLYGMTAQNNVVFAELDGFTPNGDKTQLISDAAVVVINPAEINVNLTERAKKTRDRDDTILTASQYLVYRNAEYANTDVWSFGVFEEHGAFMLNASQYTVTYTVDAVRADHLVNAGVYSMTITIPAEYAGNYKVVGEGYTISQGEGDTTITWNNAFTIYKAQIRLQDLTSVTYNGLEQKANIVLVNASGTDVIPTAYSTAYTGSEDTAKPLNAGEYTVKLTLGADELKNFVFIGGGTNTDVVVEADGAEISDGYEITPATVNPALDVNTLISYDGKEHKGNVRFTNALGGTVVPTSTPDEYSVAYEFEEKVPTEFKKVGMYTVTVTLTESGNFTFGKSGEGYIYTYDLTYSIIAKSIATAQTKDGIKNNGELPDQTYTGESLTPSIALSIALEGETLTDLSDGDYYVTHTADIEAYTQTREGAWQQTVVTVTIYGLGNYSGSMKLTFKIVPAKVSVTADGGIAPDGTVTKDYNKNRQSITPTFTNAVNSGVLPAYSASAAYSGYTITYKNQDPSDTDPYTTGTPVNAGKYDVTVELKEHGNFTFDDGELEKSFVLEIEKAQLRLTLAETFAQDGAYRNTFTYDGANWYTRLNTLTLDNKKDNNIVPAGSEYSVKFYVGDAPADSDVSRIIDAAGYCLVFAYTSDDVAKNYEVVEIVVVEIVVGGSTEIALHADDNYTVDGNNTIVKFTVTPAEVTVNPLANKTYTSREITADITFTNAANAEILPTSFTATYQKEGADAANAATDAGDYTVTVTLTGQDAINFTIVAWEGDTKTRPFKVDPAQVTVTLEQNIVPYSGDVHTVQAVFRNTSNTDTVPDTVLEDYDFTITYDEDKSVAYDALLDANTYTVVVNLNNPNYVYVSGEMTSQNLNYTITPGTITLSDLGNQHKSEWENVTYDPAHPFTLQLQQGDIQLVGSNPLDLAGLAINYMSCSTADGSYETETDGRYKFTKRGRYTVEVQVSAPNHNTATFTYIIEVTGEGVLIYLTSDLTDALQVTYGSEYSANDLLDQVLQMITDGRLTVSNIPGISETSGQNVVNWLKHYNFGVEVAGAGYSHSGHLNVGSYALTVRLPDVDQGIRFAENWTSTSTTKFYKVTPLTIEIDWSITEGRVFSGSPQSEAIRNGLEIGNLIAGDQVNFGRTSVTVGTKKDGGFTSDNVLNAVDALGGQIQYYLRVLTQDGGIPTLEGDDRANYVFAEDGQTEDHYFEHQFTLARLELQIVLAASTSTYGDEKYSETFSYTYRSDLDVNAAELRKVVIPLLKLYESGVSGEEVTDAYPTVGDYTVKANTTETDFGNYELTFVSTATHTVTQRAVTLRLASVSGVYGEDPVLPSGEEAWTEAAGSSKVLEKDLKDVRSAITLHTSAYKGATVDGSYNVTATLSANKTTDNYTINFEEGVFTVTPRPIVIVIKDRSSVYGEALDDADLGTINAWSVSETINKGETESTLNYGLYETDNQNSLGVTLKINLTYSGYPTCNYQDGEIVPWDGAVTGEFTNSDYQVTWEGGDYTVTPRTVEIEINTLSSIYGEAYTHIGSRLTLNAPTVSADGKHVDTAGDWTYATLDSTHFTILDVDLSNLTFYLGKASSMSESAYAYVGQYPIVGAWAYGFEGRPVDYCYEITFTGDWQGSLNEKQTFDGVEDGAAGIFTINNASITQDGEWSLGKLFYETSAPEKTEENGWFKMFLEELLFTLKGDFTQPLQKLPITEFRYASGTAEDGKVTFTATLIVNGQPETISVSYTKPIYRGTTGTPRDDEPYFNADDHHWYVHTSGTWRTDVTISVANHTDATFTLRYVISECIATVTLNQALGGIDALYGDYKYLALDPEFENYNEADIADLDLTKRLTEYIFNDRNMIITVTGFDTAFPESTDAENIARIVDNCWIEVADARVSEGGYLAAGYYTLRLVARSGCGFTAMFKASSLLLQPGEVDQGAGNRLHIRQREVDIDWADPDSANEKEHIVEGADRITYTYSGYDYAQQPKFTGVLAGDAVADPTFRYLTEDGSVVDAVHDVRKDGYYTISIERNVLERRADDSGNYYLSSDKSIRLDVIPRAVTVEIDDLESTVYGVEPDVDRTFTQDDWHVSEADLAYGETADDLNVELFIDLPSRNAGFYAGAVDGRWDNENYAVTFTGGDYTITPKAIEITIEDKEGYYGDELQALTFVVDEDTLAYGETAADLRILLAREAGLDVGEYAITGTCGNGNYEVTWTDGLYTILRATNVWLREFAAFEFPEGQDPPEEQLAVAKFGKADIFYFYDEACTQVILDDVKTLVDGTYYVRVFVQGTNNYTALDNQYTITITPSFTVLNGGLDIGWYVVIWSVQVVALIGGLLFIRRWKHNKGTKKS